MTHYDLIIIGGGPAGYVAAKRAAQNGLTVLLAEARHLGGVCLNEGCIPSKTLLHSAKLYHHATQAAAYGVRADHVSFDFPAVQARKQRIIESLRKDIAGLMKKHKIRVVHAPARLLAHQDVQVGDDVFTATHVLIATGSSPARPPIPGIDLPGVVDSTGLLETQNLPSSLVVIGGGVIGCEFACFFGSLGVPVTVLEMLPEICAGVEPDIAARLRAELADKNITFIVGARVDRITDTEVQYTVGDRAETVSRDLVLLATGRTANVHDVGLETRGVDVDRRGIRVDDRGATNVPGVWAAGDVTGRIWLAHAASRMAEVVVNNIAGRPDRMRYHTIPGVIYTSPEVATVGWTAHDAHEQGRAVRTAALPLTINGRYLAEHDDERGLVKVVVDADTGALLGAHFIGGACSEMIYGAATMIEMEMRVNEVADLVFPHPTVSETLRDAIMAAR